MKKRLDVLMKDFNYIPQYQVDVMGKKVDCFGDEIHKSPQRSFPNLVCLSKLAFGRLQPIVGYCFRITGKQTDSRIIDCSAFAIGQKVVFRRH